MSVIFVSYCISFSPQSLWTHCCYSYPCVTHGKLMHREIPELPKAEQLAIHRMVWKNKRDAQRARETVIITTQVFRSLCHAKYFRVDLEWSDQSYIEKDEGHLDNLFALANRT